MGHIDDPNRRLALAKRFNAGKSIVDSLVELKRRDELEQYIEYLNIRDNVRIHAEYALKNLVSQLYQYNTEDKQKHTYFILFYSKNLNGK